MPVFLEMFKFIISKIWKYFGKNTFHDDLCTVGLAYLWETTSVLGTKALSLFADDMFELPRAPWIKEVGPLY